MIKVGIVEDSRTFRQSLKENISAQETLQLVMVASDGKEFLEKMKTLNAMQRPNIVLMDVEMPELDGIATITIAKELYPEIEFIVLTTFDEDDKVFEAIKAGASGYLLKEEKMQQIIEAVLSPETTAPMSPRIARKTLQLLRRAPANSGTGGEEYNLSDREMTILQLLVEGNNYQHIAKRLFISPLTVKKHIRNIYAKLHVNSKVSAVKIAMKKGWFKS